MTNDFSRLFDSGMFAGMLVAVLIGAAIGIVIAVFYYLTLQNTLKQCAPQNQQIPPAQVWLGFIPIFNYYWHFKIAQAMSDSLAAEYRMRGMQPSEERPGYQVGMAYAILNCVGLLSWVGVPVIPQLAGLAGFICWIVYWVRMARYKRELEQHQFQFGMGNPNVYQFPNQFPGQQQQYNQGQNPYINQQQFPNQPPQNPGPPPNQ
jgi:hypothetical protein